MGVNTGWEMGEKKFDIADVLSGSRREKNFFLFLNL